MQLDIILITDKKNQYETITLKHKFKFTLLPNKLICLSQWKKYIE